MKLRIIPIFAALTLCGLTGSVTAEEKYVTIGTGGQTGVYYVVGQSICRLVNRDTAKTGIKCTAPSTGGSVANLNAIKSGDQNMGVVQSDQQYNAYKGEGAFKEAGAWPELRAVFGVHPEVFTVVARADAGIKSFDDLKGKRVNIGNPGSGQRATMEVVLAAKGWTTADFQLASELKAAEQAQALCDNKIDAMVYVVGHPSGSIQEASSSCDSVIVPVTGKEIDDLVAANSYYAKSSVKGGVYKGTDADVDSFGVVATFASSTASSEETIYQVVKAVFDNFDRFKKLHPAFENLKEENMLKDGLTAPLHDGAVKYYKEKGWM
ncbi:MAG: TAXI family TRAP transporter solute-binding subunit [Chromatiaceae bacterium]|nr:TAXI family TRAP transporter solute-binding subunit [Gammaproteobacteria bacterium]MCB1862318.1 TAXI family TRAP transporter solute-binding subunit [Gammaproteobacteria bacterium]MCP5445706.1 TAXI family TRAP transporter solute-binding subunit [Chromatiaceae bacterium]